MSSVNINLNPTVPSISKFEDKTKVDVRYVVISPFVSIHIHWDKSKAELIYEVEEPILSDKEKKLLDKIESMLREVINFNLSLDVQSQEALINYIDKNAKDLLKELGVKIDEESYKKIFYYLFRDFVGFNQIEPILRDYYVEDIECNGAGEPIYLVHRVFRNMRTNVKFDTIEEAANFVEKIAQKTGRYISYASPILDGSLPDGSRVNATYTKDITSKGPTFTIRKFTKIPWTPIQLIKFNSISADMLAYFWLALQYNANIMIVGGTSSGKTTLLNAIAFFIPPEDRVVSIEDTRELNLPRENWLPSVVRTGTSTGNVGEVDMFSLLRGSFRQNPDYVIVGEVRGVEASVLFQGMASGHSSISTLHADSVQAIVNRLSTPPISLSPTLINSLDIVAVQTHAIVAGHETRRLREIIEVVNVQSDGSFQTNTPFRWNPANDTFLQQSRSIFFNKINEKYGISPEELQRELEYRKTLLMELLKRKITGYDEVQRILNEYSKDSKSVLRKFGII